MKKTYFKIRLSRDSQISLWKTNFFPSKLYQMFLLFYALPTQEMLHTEFGLIGTTPWPDQKDLFLKFLIRESQRFRMKSVWNTNFFLLGKQ